MRNHQRSRRSELAIALDGTSDVPLYLQIAGSISADIRDARLRPGDPLPGSRTLAHALGVHRNTVLAAYTELVTEGWVRTEIAGGTFVADDLPRRKRSVAGTSRPRTALEPGYPLAPAASYEKPPSYPTGTLILAKGAPDVRLLPALELARAYRRVLVRDGARLLTYGDPRGLEAFREVLATNLANTRGINATSDAILVTRGSQMAIDLAARVLIKRGDVVVVEELGHRAAWNAFRLAGARLVAAPVDRDGMCIDALETIMRECSVRAIYVTPHHQFPTTAVMPPSRRARLLELARAHGTAIIEDDYDHEFHYDGRPVLPLASADPHGVVLYIGTFTKTLAPGLRMGFVVAPTPVIEAMTSTRVTSDLQGDLTMESALVELFQNGEYERHIHRMRQAYHSRRDALVGALARELGSVVSFDAPSGGMALWARIAPEIDVDEWAHRALAHGVAFRGARMYDFRGESQPFARLGFSFHDESELAEAVRRMATALRELGAGMSGVPSLPHARASADMARVS